MKHNNREKASSTVSGVPRDAWAIRIGVFSLYLLCGIAAGVYYVQLRTVSTQESYQGPFVAVYHGQAHTPFQYRVLIPYAIRGLQPFGIYPSPQLLQGIDLAAFVALLLAFRRLLANFVDNRYLGYMLSFTIVPVMMFNLALPEWALYRYIWDTPSVFFFTLLLHWLWTGKWVWFYVMFPVATLNKETTCFLVIILFLMHARTVLVGDLPNLFRLRFRAVSPAFWQLVSLTAIWFAVKLGLRVVFRDNPGRGLFESPLFDNPVQMTRFLSLSWYPLFLSANGYTWLPTIVGFWVNRKHPFTKVTYVLVPYALIMAVIGVNAEIRIYSELIPVCLVATILLGKTLAEKEAAGLTDSVGSSEASDRVGRRFVKTR